MAFQVKDLMFTLNPSESIPMHLTCGPISVETTQCPAVSANEPRSKDRFDCGLATDTNCQEPSCAYDSARLRTAPSEANLEQLRRQLAGVREAGSLN